MYATEKAVDVKKEGKARQVAKGKIPVGEKWSRQYLNISILTIFKKGDDRSEYLWWFK